MKKRLLSAALSLAMLLPMLPVQALAADEDEEIYSSEGNDSSAFVGGNTTSDDNVYTETVRLDEEEFEFTNDDLLEGFIMRSLLPEDGSTSYSNIAGSRLKGATASVYTEVKKEIERIAAGKLKSSVITIDVSELNITSIESNNNSENNLDTRALLSALLFDCPYELYWFDKTTGIGTSATKGGNVYTSVEITFYVAKEYSAANEERTTTLRSTEDVSNAISKANKIVADHASESDYQKLISYRDEICKLVDYNYAALPDKEGNELPYGNPWQLIWVFDGKTETTVVCEGYSKAFQYLCDLTFGTLNGEALTSEEPPIKCYPVSGTLETTNSSGQHMWNIVTMDDGANYLVDVTNCDTNASGTGGTDTYFLKAASGTVDYGYTVGGLKFVYDLGAGSDGSNMKDVYSEAMLTLSNKDYDPPRRVSKIEITQAPDKMTYTVGEQFSSTGMEVTATYTDDGGNISSETVPLADCTITVDDPLTVNSTSVMVSYGGQTATQRITVNRKTLGASDFSLSSKSFVYNGSTRVPGVTGPEGIGIFKTTYYKENETTTPVENPTDAGKYDVYVEFDGDGNYTALTPAAKIGTFEITKADVAISVTPASVSLTPGNTQQLNVTTTPAVTTLNYGSNAGSIATVDGNGVVTAVAVGNTTITVSYAGDVNHNPASKTVDVTVSNKPAQAALTINGTATMKFGTTQRLSTRGGSGNGGVTWQTSDSTIATIDTNGVLTPVSVGKVTVTATKAEDATYAAATATFEVTIEPAEQPALHITRKGSTQSISEITLKKGETLELATTGGAGLSTLAWSTSASDKVSVDANGKITALGGGEATITATMGGSANYQDVSATLKVNVSRADRTLTIEGANTLVYGGTTTLSARPGEGTGEITWTVASNGGNAELSEIVLRAVTGAQAQLKATRAGRVTVTATIAADDDYNAASANLVIDIAKADRAFSITDAGGGFVTSGQTLQLRTQGGSDNGIVTWSVESDGGTATIDQNGKLTAGNAGEVVVTATKAADMNFNAATATQTIVIQKANYSGNTLKEVVMNPGQSMEIDLTGYYPSGSTFDSVSVKSEAFFDGTPAFSDGKLSVKLMEGLEADSWNKITIPVKHSNYNDFDIIVRVEVTEKTIQNLSFAQPTMTVTYGDADFTNRLSGAMTDVTYTVSSPDNGVVTVDSQTGRISIVKAGTANIMATAAETDKYAASVDYFTVIVNPKPLTISAVNRTARVGGTAPVLGEVQGTDYNVSGLVGSDTVSGVSVRYAATPDMDIAGTTVILVFGGTVSSNYDVTYVNGTLTVTNQTVTPVDPTPTPEPEPERPVEEERRPVTIGGGSSSSNNNSSGSGTTTTTVTNRDGSVTETVRDADGTVTETTTATDGTVTEKVTTSDGTIAETTTAPSGASESIVTLPVRGENSVTLPISPVRAGSSAASAPVVTVEVPAARGTVKTEIPVRGVTAGTVAVLVAADGTETVVKTSVPTADGISLNVNGSMTVKIVENSKPFADVSTSDWHKDAVDFASARGLFNGTSATSFSPDGTMTRGMIATVLHNLEGNPAASGAVAFPDVKSGDWFSDAVQWAASTGLMNGYGSGSFGANDVLTREQLAVILWSHAGKPAAGGSLDFADAAQVSDYAREAMAWAAENGILSGANGNVMPGSSASRAQVAQMLMNYLKAYQQ